MKLPPPVVRAALTGLLISGVSSWAHADSSSQELAKQLANPLAALISVPFKFKYDQNIGPTGDGKRTVLNIQPVIPFALNNDWNIISRTILPVIWQSDVTGAGQSESGLGDTVQSIFFSPNEPTSNGWIWGVGPVFLLPTATDSSLGRKKWGVGVTGVALKQIGPWTVGGLFNHVWSVAGDNSRPDISESFLNPFISYSTPEGWSFSMNTESVYSQKTKEWSVPLNFNVDKIVKIGGQPISIGGGVRYWAESPANAAEGWGATVSIKLLFPKG